jgi:ABC-type lipoprotein release transport system permease subunit
VLDGAITGAFSAFFPRTIVAGGAGSSWRLSTRGGPKAFGGVMVAMAAVILAASFHPAWKALRTDPVQTLREE